MCKVRCKNLYPKHDGDKITNLDQKIDIPVCEIATSLKIIDSNSNSKILPMQTVIFGQTEKWCKFPCL